MPYVRGVAATYPPPGEDHCLIPLPPPVTFHRPRPVRKVPSPPPYVKDWSQVTPEEVHAATTVAGAWRGFMTRRQYRTNHITADFQYRKAVKLQSFVRVVGAKVARRDAYQAREAWVRLRTEEFINNQLDKLEQLVGWQRAKYEVAAIKIQRLFRWYIRIKKARETRRTSVQLFGRSGKRNSGSASGSRLDDGDLADEPMPTSARKTSIFNYERRRSTKLGLGGSVAIPSAAANSAATEIKYRRVSKVGGAGLPALKESDDDELALAPPSSTQLVLMDSPKRKDLVYISPLRTVKPPPFSVIISENTKMRNQLLAHQADLECQQDRIRAKQHGIIVQDMPHCAAVLQRRFRMGLAAQELHSRQCRSEYFAKYAVIVQRAIKCYFSRCLSSRKRDDLHAKARRRNRQWDQQAVARLIEEYNWNRFAMDKAAAKIQGLWRAYAKYVLRNCSGSMNRSMSECLSGELALEGSTKSRMAPKVGFRRWRDGKAGAKKKVDKSRAEEQLPAMAPEPLREPEPAEEEFIPAEEPQQEAAPDGPSPAASSSQPVPSDEAPVQPVAAEPAEPEAAEEEFIQAEPPQAAGEPTVPVAVEEAEEFEAVEGPEEHLVDKQQEEREEEQ
jgi:hypothetical protein